MMVVKLRELLFLLHNNVSDGIPLGSHIEKSRQRGGKKNEQRRKNNFHGVEKKKTPDFG